LLVSLFFFSKNIFNNPIKTTLVVKLTLNPKKKKKKKKKKTQRAGSPYTS
jgi:hypothetical protein